MLSLKQAIHFPVLLFGSCKIMDSDGDIIIGGKVRRGMLRIGYQRHRLYGSSYTKACTILNIKGHLFVNGRCSIGNGSIITIEKMPY